MTIFYKEFDLVQTEDGKWKDTDEGTILTTEEVIKNYRPRDGAFCESCMGFIDFHVDGDKYASDDEGCFMCEKCVSWYKVQTGV